MAFSRSNSASVSTPEWTVGIYTGWERLDDGIGGGIDHAQSWVLVPMRESKQGYHGSEAV